MATANTNSTRQIARFFAAGVLLSMVSVYLLHFFGTWESGNYRRDAETTSSVIVTNKCALLDDTHVLRPATSLTNKESNNELKFAGSFMNFFDGHVVLMVVLSFVLALVMFAIKKISSSSTSFSTR